MKQLAIPLGHQKTVSKWLVISQTRRENKIAPTHMFDMLEVIFCEHPLRGLPAYPTCEQHSMATEVGFLEKPFIYGRFAVAAIRLPHNLSYNQKTTSLTFYTYDLF